MSFCQRYIDNTVSKGNLDNRNLVLHICYHLIVKGVIPQKKNLQIRYPIKQLSDQFSDAMDCLLTTVLLFTDMLVKKGKKIQN